MAGSDLALDRPAAGEEVQAETQGIRSDRSGSAQRRGHIDHFGQQTILQGGGFEGPSSIRQRFIDDQIVLDRFPRGLGQMLTLAPADGGHLLRPDP